MIQPELDRVYSERARDLVHVHLARVVVGRRGQTAIRALLQRRVRRVELNALVRHLVRGPNRRAAGVPVVELPRSETALAVHRIARPRLLDLPICEEVYQVLYADKPVLQAVSDLLARPLKREWV